MTTAEGLIYSFTRNSGYVHTHLDGLTHEDALVQPPVQGNCILWIVGHIIWYRNYILEALKQPTQLPESKRFDRGTQPVLGDEPGLPRLETLVAAYDHAQELIAKGINAMTPEEAVEVITLGGFTMPRADLVVSWMRHEAYHAGQLELLREIALSQRSKSA